MGSKKSSAEIFPDIAEKTPIFARNYEEIVDTAAKVAYHTLILFFRKRYKVS
jgi:hypothetical protein